MATPDVAVAAKLDTDVGALTLGTNLFEGKARAPNDQIPHEAVFVLSSGGAPPLAYGGQTSEEMLFPSVQCIVRSNPRDFFGGRTLAKTVHDALHHQALAGYLDVNVQESEPLYLGEDDTGHHEWSLNFELWIEE